MDSSKIRVWATKKGMEVGSRGGLPVKVLDEYMVEWLVLTHMDAADSVAVAVFKTATYAIKLDETKAEAYWALVTAARRWVPYCEEKGYSSAAFQFFKPFAQRRIRGAIYDDFRAKDWASRTLRSRSKQLHAAGQLEGKSIDDMASATGLSVNTVKSTLQGMSREPASLDVGTYEYLSSVDSDIESTLLTNSLLQTLVNSYCNLSFIQQIIVALRYHKNMSMKDISLELGAAFPVVSKEHASAILSLLDALSQEAQENIDA